MTVEVNHDQYSRESKEVIAELCHQYDTKNCFRLDQLFELTTDQEKAILICWPERFNLLSDGCKVIGFHA